MKRLFSILLALTLVLVLAVPALAAEVPLVYDGAQLLSSGEEQALLARLEQVSEAYQTDVAVVTVDSTEGYGADWYVELWYDEYSYGRGSDRSGVLLMVAMGERDYRIISNGFAAQAITLDEIYDIGDAIAGDLSDGDYADAFGEFVDLCVYELDGEINGFPFDFGMNLLISLVIGLVAALIVTGILRGQLKSVRSRRGAEEYTRPGSMHLTRSGDLFLYRTLDRRRRPQNNGSSGRTGGGGGSRNVGGGKF